VNERAMFFRRSFDHSPESEDRDNYERRTGDSAWTIL